MKRIRIFLLLCAVLSFLSQPSRAGLRDDVLCLADSLMEGRGHASRGAVEASAYIMRRFRHIGLAPKVQSFRTQKGIGRNIIARYQGDVRSDKYILVCAHYDGLGCIEGTVYPGADTNASGVAVLLYLAEQFMGSGRNFIFVAMDGHSEGLAGARAFATTPWRLSLVVNLDTMGTTLAPPHKHRLDYLIALGGEPYEKKFVKANEQLWLRMYYDYYRSKSFTDYFYNKISEQAPFIQRGVPAVMFTSGITMNTNKVSDVPASFDWDIFQKRAELVRNWLMLM